MNQPRINIVVPDPLWIKIKKISREQDRSLSYVIRQALTEKFMPNKTRSTGANK
jgi:hypothetical protein